MAATNFVAGLEAKQPNNSKLTNVLHYYTILSLSLSLDGKTVSSSKTLNSF